MVYCTEVVTQKVYSEDQIYVDVYVAVIMRRDAETVLDLFCRDIPLQNYGLQHIKRIQPSDRSNKASPLHIVVCPVSRFDEAPEHVRAVCIEKQVVIVCRIPPVNRQEFEAWNQRWPLNFHASHLEKEREKGLTAEELEQVDASYAELSTTEAACGGAAAGVIVNPENGKVITTSTKAMARLRSRLPGGEARDPALLAALYPPTMLCIDGVAAAVRGEDADAGDSLPENAYLCSGLDLYLTEEPDLMSAMALVHSRIRRVFFQRADSRRGALLSGRGHIYCLRALNHRYRVFQLSESAPSIDS